MENMDAWVRVLLAMVLHGGRKAPQVSASHTSRPGLPSGAEADVRACVSASARVCVGGE